MLNRARGIEMKNAFLTRIASAGAAAFAAVALTSANSTLLLAQQPAPRPPSSSKPTFYPQPSGADVDRMERDRRFNDLHVIEKVKVNEKAKPTERDREMALKQATEDFERLRDMNQETLASLGATLDYKRVFEVTAEIQKRSTRLKSNLLLPVIATDKKKKLANEMNDNHFGVSISGLRQLITNFVTNPVFYGDGSIDTKLQTQAARDLDGVIELSGKINKRAEKLEKSAAKPK
jgi:hypothetical protein